MSDNSPTPSNTGPNLPLIIGGIVLLGAAFLFILFGGQLFNRNSAASNEAPASVADQLNGGSLLEQVPAFEEAEVETAVLPSGFGSLQVGDPVPDFTLRDLDGNKLNAFCMVE